MQRIIQYLGRPGYGILTRNISAAALIFIASFLLFLFTDANGEMMVLMGLCIPYAILQYTAAVHFLLPLAYRNRRSFWSFMVMIGALLVGVSLPFGFATWIFHQHGDDAVAFTIMNSAINFFVMAPLAWYFYRRSNRVKEEVVHLKQELGQSEASLDFLRSQVNPHFLFNALNSIYALALNEGAERTAGAAQMLGEMMRFLIHDNQQQEIDLAKEVEYLENFIRLQQLRTDGSEHVLVSTAINPVPDGFRVAPMLLIPFVENAFKHGISFRTPSYIRVSLDVRDSVLYFDVSNSCHARTHEDPERFRSGIGLANVRQRLSLLYPGRHELFVRDTGVEYFVHLTIRLS